MCIYIYIYIYTHICACPGREARSVRESKAAAQGLAYVTGLGGFHSNIIFEQRERERERERERDYAY